MDASGTNPHVGVARHDLPEAAELFDRAGPFVSVALNTERSSEGAAARFELRWKDHRNLLRDRGAPEELLEGIGVWLAEARTEGPALAVVADADGTLVTAIGHDELAHEHAAWDSLPRVGPLVAWYQSSPSALLVLVDRTGAELVLGGRQSGPLEVVEGDDGPSARGATVGGWSPRRYQHATEQAWRANAAEVAEAVAHQVARVQPRLVVVAGDERATQLLIDDLPAEVTRLVRRASGGRGPGSEGHLADEAARLYRTVVAEDTVALLEALKQELGQRDRGVSGVADTAAALRAAAVDTLVVHDDPADERRIFFDAQDPLSAAVGEDDLVGDEHRDGRVVDVAIRAAWAGGGAVRLTPRIPELTDGIGALLRMDRGSVPSVED